MAINLCTKYKIWLYLKFNFVSEGDDCNTLGLYYIIFWDFGTFFVSNMCVSIQPEKNLKKYIVDHRNFIGGTALHNHSSKANKTRYIMPQTSELII